MKQNKVRVGLIGCGGYMRWAHVPVLLKHKHAEIAAVCDPQQSQIDSLLEKAGITRPGYSDYREMIEREKLDAVFISTPHSMHYEQARFALEHGLHVLVQKPFTIRADHAEKLIALAEKKSLYIMVSYQRFYHEQSVYAAELIAKGHIGEVRSVGCFITQNWNVAAGVWRMNPLLSGGGFVMDTGSHLVSVVLRITGLRPVSVAAVVENYGRAVDISSVAAIRFDNGALCSLSFFGNASRHEEIINIQGSKGSIELSGSEWQPHPLKVNGQVVTIPKRFKPGSPDNAFIEWIRSGGQGYAPPQTAVDTIKLTQALYRSAEGIKPVKVKL